MNWTEHFPALEEDQKKEALARAIRYLLTEEEPQPTKE